MVRARSWLRTSDGPSGSSTWPVARRQPGAKLKSPTAGDQQPRVGEVPLGHEEPRADRHREAGIPRYRQRPGNDLEGLVAERNRVAHPGIERQQQRRVQDRMAPLVEARPLARRVRGDLAIERIPRAHGAHPRQPRPSGSRQERHRGEGGRLGDRGALASQRRKDCIEPGSTPRAEKTMSPPISARDCSRTERLMLPANESIATSAATPREMDDMYNSSRRRVDRDSRQANPMSGNAESVLCPPAPLIVPLPCRMAVRPFPSPLFPLPSRCLERSRRRPAGSAGRRAAPA